MVASVAEERRTTEVENLPVDVVTIAANADLAWDMDLSTSTREAIDLRTAELIGYLNLLRKEDLGQDQDEDAARLLRVAERHLDPDGLTITTVFEAYNFMRDTSVFVKALVGLYRKTHPEA